MSQLSISIDNSFYGHIQGPLHLQGVSDALQVSVRYICPVCQREWAKVEASPGVSVRFLPKIVPCKDHSDGHTLIAGSLQLDGQKVYNSTLLSIKKIAEWEQQRQSRKV